jgi:hypothetical protein
VKIESLKRFTPITFALVLLLGLPAISYAYVGPGAGLSIIGSLLAFFAAIIVGIFGFLWFPIRRLMKKRKQAKEQASDRAVAEADSPAQDSSHDGVVQGKSDA